MKRIILLVASIITSAFVFFTISCNTTEAPINYTYSFKNVWWSDSIDSNQDGFAQFRRLNFNVHLAEKTTRKVQARVYYKLKDASDYTFYAYSDQSEVLGNNVDNNLFISIGKPNKELARGYYNFSVELYDVGNNKLEIKTDSQFVKLFNKAFEQSSNDNSYSMNVWWTNKYDRSQNGYMRNAILNLNLTNDQNQTKKVDVKLYYKLSTDVNYTLLNVIPNYQVNGTKPDTISWPIGYPNLILDRNAYDFKIEIYSSNILNAFIDQANPLLKDVKFETADEDSYHYSFAKVWWSDSIDVDKDSFTEYRKLHFDVDVAENVQRSVFAKIFVLHPDSSDYQKYDSTSTFQIKGTGPQDAYSIPIGTSKVQLDSAKYDFLISIYEPPIAGVDTLDFVATTISGTTDSSLHQQRFETLKQDTTKIHLPKR